MGCELLAPNNAPTVIAGVARMAGTYLFRSFDFQAQDAEPGDPMLSEEANVKGPQLMQLLGDILIHFGINISEAYVGSNDPNDQRVLGFLETQALLQPKFETIRTGNGLS